MTNDFAHDHAVPYGYGEVKEQQQGDKQFLVKTTKHITGEVFHDVIPIRNNEYYEFVMANDRYEALERFKEDEQWK